MTGSAADPRHQLAILAVAVAAVLGHIFPVYLRFRGGKGVATTIGVALGIWPHFTIAMVAALLIYGLVRKTTGLVSVGSLALALAFPLALMTYLKLNHLSLANHWPLQTVATLLGLVIILRHRENVCRLLQGKELRLSPPTGRERFGHVVSHALIDHQ